MSYTYYAQITIDKTKVGETDTNFAVPIHGTYDGTDGEPDLRTAANGGHIQNTASGGASGTLAVPADLVFCTDYSNPNDTKLDFEIDHYDPATGEIVAWVQCGVDTATNVTFYMVYSDLSVTTSQENVIGTWDSGYKAIQHCTGASYAALKDSTSSGHDIAGEAGTPIYQQDGKIGKAIELDAAGHESIYMSDHADWNLFGGNFTIEFWINFTSLDDFIRILGQFTDTNNYNGVWWPGGALFVSAVSGGSNEGLYYCMFNPGTGTWCHVVIVGTSDDVSVYVNGNPQEVSEIGAWGSPGDIASVYGLGDWGSSGEYTLHGLLDEIRLSNTARSAGHVTTCYNSQNSPSTFYTMGTEQKATTAQPYAFIM